MEIKTKNKKRTFDATNKQKGASNKKFPSGDKSKGTKLIFDDDGNAVVHSAKSTAKGGSSNKPYKKNTDVATKWYNEVRM